MDKLIFITASSNSFKILNLSIWVRVGTQLFLVFHFTSGVVKPVRKVSTISQYAICCEELKELKKNSFPYY